MRRLRLTICAALASFMFPAMAGAVACQIPAGAGSLAASALAMVNVERQRAGLPAPSYDPALARSAQILACDMQRSGNFSHRGANGSTHADRARVAGCNWAGKGPLAENIAWGKTMQAPASVVAGWMASPGHRANILHRRVRKAGLAYVPSAAGGYWVIELAGGC